MPRNSFVFDKTKSNEENMYEYEMFVEKYVYTRRNEGKFINCKIYGNIVNGEVYTTWLYANLPDKKTLQLSGAIKEIAPTKQGFPCCILSKKLDGKKQQQKENSIIKIEINYDFQMVKFSKQREIDELLNEGWEVRKWFDSLKIFSIDEVKNGMNKDFFCPLW